MRSHDAVTDHAFNACFPHDRVTTRVMLRNSVNLMLGRSAFEYAESFYSVHDRGESLLHPGCSFLEFISEGTRTTLSTLKTAAVNLTERKLTFFIISLYAASSSAPYGKPRPENARCALV